MGFDIMRIWLLLLSLFGSANLFAANNEYFLQRPRLARISHVACTLNGINNMLHIVEQKTISNGVSFQVKFINFFTKEALFFTAEGLPQGWELSDNDHYLTERPYLEHCNLTTVNFN
jgi:hypothetical protein